MGVMGSIRVISEEMKGPIEDDVGLLKVVRLKRIMVPLDSRKVVSEERK